MQRTLLAGLFALAVMSAATAQSVPSDVEATAKKVLGRIDVTIAAVFTANRSTLDQTCGEKDKFFHISSGISRLEFAAMNVSEREQYIQLLQGQVRSNALMHEAMSERERKLFCDGVRDAIEKYSVNFMDRYPQLFEKRGNDR
ncbi:hypothetical protein [Hyphomicrobium sp.]|uniref:hypothetical protein n=1 Tax=Hyphomicrobium sp. TaxID=82 RepID=UPI002FE04C88